MSLTFNPPHAATLLIPLKKTNTLIQDTEVSVQNFIKVLERRLVPFHGGARRKLKNLSHKDDARA